MPAQIGINFLIQIEDAGNPGTYRTVGAQRGGTLNLTIATIDTSNKDNFGWEENIPGLRGWSIDFDGIWLEDDLAFGDLEDAYMARTQVNVRLSTPAGNTYTGAATISDLTYEGPHDDVMSLSGSLTGAGALTKA